MRISSILLENIKKFNNKSGLFTFGGESGVYTISGGNGSGKTAIFRSVQIFQKIFFFDQLNIDDDTDHIELHQKIWQDLDGLMSSECALIDIEFKIDEIKFSVILNLTKSHNDWTYSFSPRIEGDLEILRKHWNIKNPTEIVAFIDASKSFSDFGVRFDNINLLPRRTRQRQFILDCVFEPEKTLQSIYRKAVIDHVQYRIDPKRTYQYFKKANKAVKEISGNIEIGNISATKLDGQLVILGRTSKGAPLFDVKDFSSGERSLYLTLLFLFYLPSIGILIIDEPENHLHDSLLCRFHDFLENFLPPNNKNSNISLEDTNNRSLEQIFLTTHSKTLIYKNLDLGFNFSMSGDGILKLEASEIEKSLRSSGISTIHSRTLFVEGTTESSLMTEFFEKERIKVISASNCKEVISYFEKISKIHQTITSASFCFIIDRDNKTSDEIESIRNINPNYFDQSFLILDRHEIENLFIEEELILTTINKIRDAISNPPLTQKEINEIMKSEAEKLRIQSKNKYIASGLKMEIKSLILDPITDIKRIKASTIDELISQAISENSAQKIQSHALQLDEYFDNLWENDWKCYIDGKAYIGALCARLSNECGNINGSIIRRNIIDKIKETPQKFAFGAFYQCILNKFDSQGSLR